MRYEHILVGEDAGLAIVTMNRPERRNALSEAHMAELTRALRSVGDAGEARAIVLAATGPVFSSGHDFADMVERDLDGMRRLLATCTELMLTIQRVPQPVVAQVQGVATAAGCQLVASCDLAVAAEEATFATPGGKGGWFCTTPMVAGRRGPHRGRRGNDARLPREAPGRVPAAPLIPRPSREHAADRRLLLHGIRAPRGVPDLRRRPRHLGRRLRQVGA